MASTPTETNVTSTEPPPKKQKVLEYKGMIENVQKILECPVCFSTPDQAHFCSNGHLLCDSCHKKILGNKCPTCRSEDWIGQNALMPLMTQILSFLPKQCPFQECKTQFESKDREEHLKDCQHRLVYCSDCKLKLPFNTFLNHLKEVHGAYIRKNTDGVFYKSLLVKEQDFSDKEKVTWTSTMTEFDEQTFIAVGYKEQDHFYFQMFVHGNIKQAENYLWQIKVINKDDPRYNMSFTGDIISVDVSDEGNGQQNHPGTFTFAKTMAGKFFCKLTNGQGIYSTISILKK